MYCLIILRLDLRSRCWQDWYRLRALCFSCRWPSLSLSSILMWSSLSVHAQLCPTLCDCMDYSPPGSSAHGFFQARILDLVAISSFRWSSWAGIEPASPALAGEFFTTTLPTVRICVLRVSSYMDTRHTGLRVYATSSMNSSRLMASAETLLSYQRSHSQVLRLKNLKI